MKTEVYSWRLSSELKSELEREARLRKASVSSVLDVAIRNWLKKSAVSDDEDEEQRRLHEVAAKSLGALAGRNPRRSETARKLVRQRLGRRYAR
jgi:predicted transcriptional regulator